MPSARRKSKSPDPGRPLLQVAVYVPSFRSRSSYRYALPTKATRCSRVRLGPDPYWPEGYQAWYYKVSVFFPLLLSTKCTRFPNVEGARIYCDLSDFESLSTGSEYL